MKKLGKNVETQKLVQKKNTKPGEKIKMNSIPDFCFPFATQFIKETPDNKYLFGVGTYPPQTKCFSLESLNVKFQRNFDSDIVDFHILSKNWEKLVFLRSDRKLDFHTKSGFFFQVKIPERGCNLTLDSNKALLYIPSIYNCVSILDFKEGKFLSQIKTKPDNCITCSDINRLNGLFSIGMKNGKSEFWDSRILKNSIGKINISKYTKFKKNNGVTSVYFSKKSENLFFSGFDSGEVVVYDLRCFSPLLSKVIEPFNSVKMIKENSESNFILSSTSNTLKCWGISTAKTKFHFKSEININHFCPIENTGLVFFSMDNKNIGVKYFRDLGPIPEWSKSWLA